jgi:DNA-binding transcriptional regulator YhcF (GntR family)
MTPRDDVVNPVETQEQILGPHLGTPIVGRRIAEDVVDRLVTAVALGQYVTGQQLPTERELSVMLGVSRTSVREALKQLTDTGYLEVRRGRNGGYFVRANWGPTSAEHVRRQLVAHWPEFEHIFDARRLVEQLIARTATHRGAPTRHCITPSRRRRTILSSLTYRSTCGPGSPSISAPNPIRTKSAASPSASTRNWSPQSRTAGRTMLLRLRPSTLHCRND